MDAELIEIGPEGLEWRQVRLQWVRPSRDGVHYQVQGEPEGWLPMSAIRWEVEDAQEMRGAQQCPA